MKKITEIPEIKRRTRYKRDRPGKLYRYSEKYITYKQVPTISETERINHYLIDGFFVSLISLPFFAVFYYLLVTYKLSEHEIAIAFSFLIFINLGIAFFYYTFFENKYQQTPGKKSTNSIVVDEYGKKPTLKMIIQRTLYRFVPFEVHSCFGNPSYCWHDKWSKTFVIKKDKLKEVLEEINNLENKTNTIQQNE